MLNGVNGVSLGVQAELHAARMECTAFEACQDEKQALEQRVSLGVAVALITSAPRTWS